MSLRRYRKLDLRNKLVVLGQRTTDMVIPLEQKENLCLVLKVNVFEEDVYKAVCKYISMIYNRWIDT